MAVIIFSLVFACTAAVKWAVANVETARSRRWRCSKDVVLYLRGCHARQCKDSFPALSTALPSVVHAEKDAEKNAV